jgi:nitroimidazol reductase NimA-like FMN-containing flavoprotein (pyridoxamine 5'-phosphate oxidase superfamily)
MDPTETSGMIRMLLAWGAPLVLLLVVSIRFLQRNRRVRARKRTATPGPTAMRRSDRMITDPVRMDAMLSKSKVCRIAFAVHDEPYLVPLSFGAADQIGDTMEFNESRRCFLARGQRACRIYLHTAQSGRKLDMARVQPRVCIEIEGRTEILPSETSCKWSVEYESVIGYGNLVEIKDPDEKRAGLECIMRQHGAAGDIEFPQGMVERTGVLRLDLSELSGKTNRRTAE